jgi:hypothetical protein
MNYKRERWQVAFNSHRRTSEIFKAKCIVFHPTKFSIKKRHLFSNKTENKFNHRGFSELSNQSKRLQTSDIYFNQTLKKIS